MKVFFITEGSSSIGFGHITRCLGISQAFSEKNISSFFFINGDKSIFNLLKGYRFEILDWIEFPGKLKSVIKNEDIMVVDSYLASSSLLKKISDISNNIVFIDDNNRLPYPKGIVLNGNVYAKNIEFPKNKNTSYLLGPNYAPLRKEFWDPPRKIIKRKIETLLITFGGDDKRNLTPKILNLLQKNYPALKKVVVIGSGFKNFQKIFALKDYKTEFVINASAGKIKKLMLDTDLAISASGQTTLELLRVGTPSILIKVADNQKKIFEFLTKKGLVGNAGNWNDLELTKNILTNIKKLTSYEKRKSLSKRQIKITDGQGPRRIVNFVLSKIPKKILFVTNNKDSLSLADWLKKNQNEEVTVFDQKLNEKVINKYRPEFLISYNYKFIIPEKVLNLFEYGKAINLHISYLPWNKGSNPNFWSFVENTPKGVTIHIIDKGIDTGKILIQKKIIFDQKKETLSTTYIKLNNLLKQLFQNNWKKIKNLELKPKKQIVDGSVHTVAQFDKMKQLLNIYGWNIPISILNKKIYESTKN